MPLNPLYVNDKLFDHFLNDAEQHNKADISHTLGISLGVFSYQAGITNRTNSNTSFANKCNSVVDSIKSKYKISTIREREMDKCKFYHGFTLERTTATKLLFKNDAYAKLNGLKHLAVWVSDPDLSLVSDEPYTWRGTFLYLVEELFDFGKYTSCMSGCSALQALSNIIHDKPFFAMQSGEPLGRGNYKHPIQRLEEIGAINTYEKRSIVTLYRNRYLTNEICYAPEDGRKLRVNDLLGYPIFIMEDM